MIEARNLYKSYGPVNAIEDVSFTIQEGEITGFLGPNGAGKSTTMRILTAFSPATRGTATIAGHEVHESPLEVRRRIGYLPERVPLYEEMVVQAFLGFIAEVKGVARGERKREIGRVIERCGLQGMEHRLIRNLSKGYRQRVGLAAALVGNPPVLILDEPTVGLDPKQIVDIRQVIKDLAKEHTVLLSTHILPEVSMVCERVIIINRGHIVAEDRMERLAAQAGEAIVEVAGGREDILRALGKVGETREIEYGRYSVRGAEGVDVGAEVGGALVAAGHVPRRLEVRKRTLEEVFLAAVSGDREAA